MENNIGEIRSRVAAGDYAGACQFVSTNIEADYLGALLSRRGRVLEPETVLSLLRAETTTVADGPDEWSVSTCYLVSTACTFEFRRRHVVEDVPVTPLTFCIYSLAGQDYLRIDCAGGRSTMYVGWLTKRTKR